MHGHFNINYDKVSGKEIIAAFLFTQAVNSKCLCEENV